MNTQLWPPVPSPQSRAVHETNTVEFLSVHHVISQLGLGKLTKEQMLDIQKHSLSCQQPSLVKNHAFLDTVQSGAQVKIEKEQAWKTLNFRGALSEWGACETWNLYRSWGLHAQTKNSSLKEVALIHLWQLLILWQTGTSRFIIHEQSIFAYQIRNSLTWSVFQLPSWDCWLNCSSCF